MVKFSVERQYFGNFGRLFLLMLYRIGKWGGIQIASNLQAVIKPVELESSRLLKVFSMCTAAGWHTSLSAQLEELDKRDWVLNSISVYETSSLLSSVSLAVKYAPTWPLLPG